MADKKKSKKNKEKEAKRSLRDLIGKQKRRKKLGEIADFELLKEIKELGISESKAERVREDVELHAEKIMKNRGIGAEEAWKIARQEQLKRLKKEENLSQELQNIGLNQEKAEKEAKRARFQVHEVRKEKDLPYDKAWEEVREKRLKEFKGESGKK